MICARCDEPIKEGESYETVIASGATAVGSDIYRHAYNCKKLATQTYPAPRWWERH